MLMSSSSRPTTLHYMPNGFRQLSPGDHVLCAVTGEVIPLDLLRYWSVPLQEAYANAEIATKRLMAAT